MDLEKQAGKTISTFEVTRFTGPAMEFETIKTRLDRTTKPKMVKLKINGR